MIVDEGAASSCEEMANKISVANERLLNHKERLIDLINNKPVKVEETLIDTSAALFKINRGFWKGEINFNVLDIRSLAFLEYELKLILDLLENESTIGKRDFFSIMINAKKVFEEIQQFKRNLNNFILPELRPFNPVDMGDDVIFSRVIEGGYI